MVSERPRRALLSSEKYRGRLYRHAVLGLALIAAALAIGVAGYHWIAKLGWVDAILNAAMILSGMGPVDPLSTPGAKLFASAYAIFSGVFLIGVAGIIIAPVLHRILHRFHIDDEDP